jgi:RNA polymerase sigma factor (sigma-70 family)
MPDEGFRSHEFTLVKPPTSGAAASTDQTLSEKTESASRTISSDVLQKLSGLIETLPLEQREAITLYYLDRWPLARVAATMKCTPEQVAELLLSASKTLREGLGDK